MTLGVVAIDHVNVTVPPEFEGAAKVFYGRLLGLAEIPKPPELRARGGAWYQVGALQLHLSLDAASGPANKRHVCFRVADLAAAKAALDAAGLPYEDGGTAEGLTRVFVRDPAGNRIELGSRPA